MTGEDDKPKEEPTDRGLELDGYDSKYVPTTKREGVLGVFKYIAVTPGTHKPGDARGGEREIPAEWLKRHHDKAVGRPLMHVHELRDLRAVLGPITKSVTGPKGEILREADILDTAAGRDFDRVARIFPPGVSIKTDHGWQWAKDGKRLVPKDDVAWIHDGVMLDGTQADKAARGTMLHGGASLLDNFGTQPEGSEMNEEEAKKLQADLQAEKARGAELQKKLDESAAQAKTALEAEVARGAEMRKQLDAHEAARKKVEAEAAERNRKDLLARGKQLRTRIPNGPAVPKDDAPLAEVQAFHSAVTEGLEMQALGRGTRPGAPAADQGGEPANGSSDSAADGGWEETPLRE